MAAEKEVSIAQIALAYVLSQPQNIYALIACYNEAEVIDNVKAGSLQLTADEIAQLEG